MIGKAVLVKSFAGLLVVLAVLVVVVIGLWQFSKSRRVQLTGELVYRVETEERVVALTFDDGPSAEYAGDVLALLREKNVRGTFFVTGRETERNPGLARQMVEDGHELGNHSFTHPQMVLKSYGFVRDQIERTDDAIRDAGFANTPLFRPPYCKKLFMLPLYLARNRRTTITWDVEPESYKDIRQDADKITAHVLERVRPGSIILLHAMYDANQPSRDALPDIIDGLRNEGYEFVTVSELIKKK